MGLDSLKPYGNNYDMKATTLQEGKDNILYPEETTLPQNTADILDRIDKICGKRLLIEESQTLKSLLKNTPEEVPEYVARIGGKIINQDHVAQLTNLFKQFEMLVKKENTFSKKTGKERLAAITEKYNRQSTNEKSKGGTRCDMLIAKLGALIDELEHSGEEVQEVVSSGMLTTGEVGAAEKVIEEEYQERKGTEPTQG